MAVYFFNMKVFSRSGGSSAVNAAAYRSGERLHDEKSGRTYDHSGRQDVMYKEILLPGAFESSSMAWARDRGSLWNEAERVEPRKNSRVAREYLVALPVELSADRQIALARGFSRELTERYGFALDLAVHAPRSHPGSDPRNYHAHLLATTREVMPQGLGAKTTMELSGATRLRLGMTAGIHELLYVRERWATVANEALREANVEARIDHRSLAAQGIEREPRPYIPAAAFHLERNGYRSFIAENLRANHGVRVAAREGRSVAPPPRREASHVALQNYFIRKEKALEAEARSGKTPEQRWAEASLKQEREAQAAGQRSKKAWAAYLSRSAQPEPVPADRSIPKTRGRSRDDDFSL